MRKSIIMPVGTIVGGVPSIVPVQIFSDDISAMFISATSTVNLALSNNAVLATFVATDAASAGRMINAINTAMDVAGNDFTVINNFSSGLTFISATPNTGTVGAAYAGILAGTGFALAGIGELMLDDGSFTVISPIGIDGPTDTAMNISSASLPPALAYTLYYSKDGGSTWTTTGLTITTS